jgi:hypothetical protein
VPTRDVLWLEGWADEFEISSSEKFYQATRSPTAMKSLYEAAATREYLSLASEAASFPSYVAMAGSQLDLSQTYHHACIGCHTGELADLLRRTMHFFEKVLVNGPPALPLMYAFEEKNDRNLQRQFEIIGTYIEFLQYIRKIGARDRLIFAPKPVEYCENCFNKMIHDVGLRTLEDEERAKEVIEQIVKEAKFTIMRNRSGYWTASVDHPTLIDGAYSRIYSESRRPTRREIAQGIFDSLTRPAVIDLATSRHYKLPLIEGFRTSWLDVRSSESNIQATVDEVALNIRIPTISGIPLEELIKLQDDNKDHLVRFQRAIAAAIKDMMKNYEGGSPARIADAVVKDYIEPELAAIEVRMKSKQRALAKKFAASSTLGAVVTTVGLVASMPLALTTGVGFAVASLPQVFKYFDDRADVETSDLYFLAKLREHKH